MEAAPFFAPAASISSTACAASKNILKRTSFGLSCSNVSEIMNSTSIGKLRFARIYNCRSEKGPWSAKSLRHSRLVASGAHLEEGQEAVKLLLEGATFETGSTRVEEGADEAHAEAVIWGVDWRRGVGPRSAVRCTEASE